MGDSATTTEGSDGKAGDTPATPNLARTAEGLIEKHGDSTKALMTLLDENYRYRDQIRDLKARVPADGTVVLAGDDAKAYQRYRSLGDPKVLETALTERDTYRTKSEGYEREKLISDVAGVAGYKAAVLSRLATTDGLTLAVHDGKDKLGKPVRSAVVVARGSDDTETVTPLAEYAEKNWGDFLPALKGVAAVAKPTGTPPARFESQPRPAAAESNGTPRLRRNVL